jgi:hypothetical protein
VIASFGDGLPRGTLILYYCRSSVGCVLLASTPGAHQPPRSAVGDTIGSETQGYSLVRSASHVDIIVIPYPARARHGLTVER